MIAVQTRCVVKPDAELFEGVSVAFLTYLRILQLLHAVPSQPDKEILERGIGADHRDEMILKSHPDNQHQLTIPLRAS